jgi:CDP-glucose 4,6-dehydratase
MYGYNDIYRGKTVLITGHTGFKGSWLSIWLHELGAKVVGYALDPYTEKDNYHLSGLESKIIDIRGDIRDTERLNEVFQEFKPEFVFHLAAQSLVGLSYDKPVETYEINVMGTINVLEAIKKCDSVKVGIMITTDKCYDNKEQVWGYKESDPLGGYDPYSSSKGAAEIAISSWRKSYFNPDEYDKHGKSIASVRAGNVIGGGDWAKGRIIPDCVRALENNDSIEIRQPNAIRPWEYVLEPLGGYLMLGEKMYKDGVRYCEAWNFGPELSSIISVWELANKVINNYGSGDLVDASNPEDFHEAKLLSLDISKARFALRWFPTLHINEAIAYTVEWYLDYRTKNVYDLCVGQIRSFMDKSEYK